MPALQAAGRFLAPAGGYYPDMLKEPVAEAGLVSCALAEVGRGAAWVKVIADFPDLTAGTGPEPTYPVGAIGQLVTAGVNSIEHGIGLDEAAIKEMAHRGTAWTPTISALRTLPNSSGLPPARRSALQEGLDRLAELLPLAARHGVPVLASSDVTGSSSQEVVLLTQMGLPPQNALAAQAPGPASSSAHRPPTTSSPTTTTPATTPPN
jgi:hypothetical protein